MLERVDTDPGVVDYLAGVLGARVREQTRDVLEALGARARQREDERAAAELGRLHVEQNEFERALIA